LTNLISADWKSNKEVKYLKISIKFNKTIEAFFEIIKFTKTEKVNVIKLDYNESLHPNFDIINLTIKSVENNSFYFVIEKIK
jgi:(p)ppGpp synthase/HD superfamily hydrolase